MRGMASSKNRRSSSTLHHAITSPRCESYYQYFGKHKITVPVAPPDKSLHCWQIFPVGRQSLPEFKIVELLP